MILKPKKNENKLAGAYMSQKHPDFSILAARVLALADLNQAKVWGAPWNKKSPQQNMVDNVQGEFIRWLDQDNRRRILELYNDILLKQQYPDSLNQANIASIYKKGDPAKLENYRPIALLQIFYKLLASLLKLRLTDH